MRGWPVRVLVACAIATSLVTGATNGCNDDAGDEPCGSLPDRTACPLARGGSCSDPDCAAVYSCRDGAWTLVQRCSPHPPGDAGTADTGDGASCGDASAIDPGGSTCASLQLPDCDARILDSCPAKACSTGCTGFLRCTSGEWSPLYVAYCDEDGVLVQNGKKPLSRHTARPRVGGRADLDGPNRPFVGSLGSLRRGSSVPVLDALGVGGATTGGRLFFDVPVAVAVDGVLGGGTLAVDPPVAPGPWGGGMGVRPPTGAGCPPVVGGAAPVAAGGAAAPVATGGAAVVAGAAPVDAGCAAGAAPAGLLLPPERCGDDAPPRLGPETGSSAGPL